jgi:acetyl esterase/lipase
MAALLVGAIGAPGGAQSPGATIGDVAYVSDGTPDQTLDLYLPRERDYPTVVFIHGGSLRESGERRTSPPYARVCEPFVAAGVACATIDYRLAPTYRWPAMPHDAAAAVAWVRRAVTARGGDPGRLFLFGHSSGCHLAAILGANPKYLATVGLEPAQLAGVIAMGCILAPLEESLRRAAEAGLSIDDMRERWEARSSDTDRFASFEDRLDSDPSRFVGPHVPPTLVVIARAERFLPPILAQGARYVGLLYDALRPADVVIVPGTHYTSIQSIGQPDDPTFAAILTFIQNPLAAGEGSRPTRIGR